MATVTQITLTCDMCGDGKHVRTRTFGLDGKTYEIDLCPEDSKGLSQVAAGYVPKARKSTTRHAPRHNGRKPRSRAGTAAGGDRPRQSTRQISGRGRATGTQQQKGIYVYGILPADVEMAADLPGVGRPAGPLRVVRSGGLAALISEVALARRLGSPEDLKTHREILDATATEVPVLPLRFGTVVASEDAVAVELLAAHHEQFAAALEQLDGRAQFVIQGRYHDDAVNAQRQQDTRAVLQAMDGHCVASVVREPAHELDAIHVVLLVDADKQSGVEGIVNDLAREWERRIEVQLLGPMAAYDFAESAKPAG
jgi:Gas vesicle synthesis protein GvpL/GvpF/Lsr2